MNEHNAASIHRVTAILEQQKRRRVPFDQAWDVAVDSAHASDLRALSWARKHYQAAYEGRRPTSVESAAELLRLDQTPDTAFPAEISSSWPSF